MAEKACALPAALHAFIYYGCMDVLLLLVVLGCAIVGLIWGALRIFTTLLAITAAVLAARFAAPAAAGLLARYASLDAEPRVVATIAVAAVAAGLVLLAGRGLRRGIEALRLGWLDRAAGGVLAGAAATLVLAGLLALAADAGHVPSSRWALSLAGAGRAVLALHSTPESNSSPSSTPATATSNGQQPR